MLSDIDIKNSIKNNDIEISPLIEDYIQPSSVDLRVGADFRVFENHKYSHIDHLYFILVNLFLELRLKKFLFQIKLLPDSKEKVHLEELVY